MTPPKVKPLVSSQTQPDTNQQFKHFGVMNAGSQGKGSFLTSLIVNLVIAFVVCVVGAAVKKTVEQQKLVNLTFQPEKPPPPPEPKPIKPLPPPPKMPEVVKLEPPKIKLPDTVIEPPKMPEIKLQPAPVNLPPAPPKLVKAPAAPQVVHLNQPPQAAAIANNQVAAPIRMGNPDNPIKSTAPAVATVSLGQAGAHNMPSSNTGLGAVSKVTLGGNGQPTGGMTGNGLQAVQGVKLGVQGSTGPMDSKGRTAGSVSLAQAPPPPPVQKATTTAPVVSGAPKVLYKPAPEYTAEARAKHIEGTIAVKIRVAANGAVTVLGLGNDLGYGLGASATRAVQGTRFQPATDAQGHPVDWTGQVNVLFQLAG